MLLGNPVLFDCPVLFGGAVLFSDIALLGAIFLTTLIMLRTVGAMLVTPHAGFVAAHGRFVAGALVVLQATLCAGLVAMVPFHFPAVLLNCLSEDWRGGSNGQHGNGSGEYLCLHGIFPG